MKGIPVWACPVLDGGLCLDTIPVVLYGCCPQKAVMEKVFESKFAIQIILVFCAIPGTKRVAEWKIERKCLLFQEIINKPAAAMRMALRGLELSEAFM